MATHMSNTVPGIVSFRSPVVMQVRLSNEDGPQHTAAVLVQAVKGTWTTNATGTDGKITVTDILSVNQDQFQHLESTVTLDTVPAAAGAANITAMQ